jgi:hypothetical protein
MVDHVGYVVFVFYVVDTLITFLYAGGGGHRLRTVNERRTNDERTFEGSKGIMGNIGKLFIEI